MDTTSEIKARLPIEELVGEYAQIQKKGRNFVALCPFHNDTHPSFLISPDKGIAYCFACQTGGDIFSFYQEIEGVDFKQALRDLAEKAGVVIKEQKFTPGPKKDEKERMRECLEGALAFYRSALKENEKAQTYLAERNLTPELIETFEIGFAPDSFDATYTQLLKDGFSRSEILGAGLGIQKDLQQEKIYDRFRNRIMFPIRNHQGHLIGFGGRTLGADDAKYINSPDGPLYNKSVALFGLPLAKEAIRKSKSVILVEGYFDVAACHRIGIQNVVAVSGTALTPQHVQVVKRNAEHILLCMDQDIAGQQAAERAFLLCKAQDLDVRALTLPAGKDPDECAHLEPTKMKELCAKGGVPYLDAVIAELSEKKLEKRAVLQRLLPLLSSIPSAVEREDAMKKTAALLGATITTLQDDLEREKQAQERGDQEKKNAVHTPFESFDLLMGLLLTYPTHLPLIERVLEPAEEKTKAVYGALKPLAGKKEQALRELTGEERERASVLQLYCEEHFGTWSESVAEREIKKLCQKVNKSHLLGKQKVLIESIRAARSAGKKVEEEQLLTQYQQVLKLSAMAS